MRIMMLLVFLMCCSCDNFFSGYEQYPKSSCEKAVNRVMARNAKELGQKYKMRPCAVTVGMPEGNIQYLALEFQTIGPKQKVEIRQTLLSMCHDFLADINSDEPLLECLHGKKLSIKEIGIIIFYKNKKGYQIGQPNIGIAELIKGNICYIKIEPDAIPSFRETANETYEEALKLANESDR